MSYETKNIRNICLLGHGNSGKTSLAEGMLFATGAIDRMGKVSDGNTVCDYDAEEIKRQITISTAVAPVNFGGCKINVLDCPGYFDFVGDALAAIRVSEAGIIFCSAKDGISVGAERSWKYLREANVPAMFYISKIDEEHGDFYNVLSALQETAPPAARPPRSQSPQRTQTRSQSFVRPSWRPQQAPPRSLWRSTSRRWSFPRPTPSRASSSA